MQRRHQGIGLGGEHHRALHLTAIGANPAVPQRRQPKRFAIGARDAVALFKKGIGRQQPAPVPPGPAKAGLLHHRFSAGIEGPWGLQGIFAPLRQQAPQHQSALHRSMLLALQQHRFSRTNQGSWGVVLRQPRGHRPLQMGQQGIKRTTQGKASAHRASTSVRFSPQRQSKDAA